MIPELGNESIREIIGNHVFYALSIIFVGISVYHGLSADSWKQVGMSISFLVIGSILMAGLSLMYAIRCHAAVKLANAMRARLMEDEEIDEEKP